METLDITLKGFKPSEGMPNSGQYVLALAKWGKLYYGFWHTVYNQFYYLGGSLALNDIEAWYSTETFTLVAQH